MLRTSLALLLIGSPAFAANNCAPRDVVLSHLGERFGEARQAIGLTAEAHVMELFASIETGTWTVTVTLPDGMTCLVVAGDAFEAVEESPLPGGVDS